MILTISILLGLMLLYRLGHDDDFPVMTSTVLVLALWIQCIPLAIVVLSLLIILLFLYIIGD